MTIAEKTAWLENATNEELLKQWYDFMRTNDWGCNNEDIALTKAEILKRMK